MSSKTFETITTEHLTTVAGGTAVGSTAPSTQPMPSDPMASTMPSTDGQRSSLNLHDLIGGALADAKQRVGEVRQRVRDLLGRVRMKSTMKM